MIPSDPLDPLWNFTGGWLHRDGPDGIRAGKLLDEGGAEHVLRMGPMKKIPRSLSS
jgi:hypothetical protein